ncbi:sulfatase-like hydrolase/transferase [Rubinisphaera margarita]|uniref:sulfatase-like hydrolase/transferase n=1 Tax=Rubinisphaera margarita TaxID=2909586 RepID=UPI001EE8C3C8|nr:sulfatase-like hydrolase/transferase [Rubinisphaera margarita]MCG6158124.1 sulfatase-like hydrolase/transferase [Rubinisphaera margarita]
MMPAFALLVVFLLVPLLGIEAAETKPNFVLIVADDLGYGDLGCYGGDSPQTPHIDRLARGGLRFTDFHSAGAMCSPTRASLMTGRYPQRFGPIFDAALSGTTQRDRGLPLEATTIAELLREAGYVTGCFGKWHLGYQPPLLPTNQGFDIFRGLVSGDGDFHTQIDRSGNEDWWHNNRVEMDEGYTTDLLTKYSVDFIAAHHEEPFFLYLPHLAIHFPWQGPEDPPHRTAGRSWHQDKWGVIPDRGNVRPHVEAMIESLDASVGAIVETLNQWELTQETVVIFTSDNGGYLTYGKDFRNISSNGEWRGQKAQLYEGGHRVPMIVSWPGRIAPGVTDELVHSNDLLPTMLSLIDEPAVSSDGIDLASLWIEREPLPKRDLFWRSGSQLAVRSGSWKLVASRKEGAKPELYNLDDDPGEQRNVATQYPTIVKKLSDAWSQWDADVDLSSMEYSR